MILLDAICSFTDFAEDYGIEGLSRVQGDTLFVLAVLSTRKGAFREFIRQAKERYRHVVVLEVMNPIVAGALERYGFCKTEELIDGEMVKGYRWSCPK